MEENYLKQCREIEKKSKEIKRKIKKLEGIKSYNPEHADLLLAIKREIPNFNENELLEFAKNVIPNIHYFLSNNKFEKVKRYCSEELIKKITKQKEKYRISTNIDNCRIQYIRLYKIENQKTDIYIKLYCSVYFYDEVTNNTNTNDFTDKYWNDIWIVTFKQNNRLGQIDKTKCPNCGAQLKYDKSKNIFNCQYCRNQLYITQINWKVIDIEVK